MRGDKRGGRRGRRAAGEERRPHTRRTPRHHTLRTGSKRTAAGARREGSGQLHRAGGTPRRELFGAGARTAPGSGRHGGGAHRGRRLRHANGSSARGDRARKQIWAGRGTPPAERRPFQMRIGFSRAAIGRCDGGAPGHFRRQQLLSALACGAWAARPDGVSGAPLTRAPSARSAAGAPQARRVRVFKRARAGCTRRVQPDRVPRKEVRPGRALRKAPDVTSARDELKGRDVTTKKTVLCSNAVGNR